MSRDANSVSFRGSPRSFLKAPRKIPINHEKLLRRFIYTKDAGQRVRPVMENLWPVGELSTVTGR